MSVVDYQRVKLVFEQVCDLAPGERQGTLDQLCGSNHELRQEVETLLVHVDAPVVDLESAACDMQTFLKRPREVPTEPPVEEIGGSRVIRVLGEGGMGVVYLAEQERPKRTVALKVLRSGMRSARAKRRFEQEADILARLQHPGIAQVYEAGTDERGFGAQPFFAMEYVEGESLMQYAKQETLSHRERMDLMIQICEAVEHAHRRGVIHRDLKPSNILVNRGGPKILDFGIARSSQSQHTTTAAGHLVGTLPYMSPEQIAGHPDAIDERSDVYALGVMMCELLTGRLPIEVRNHPIPEAIRMVREDEPTPLGVIDRTLRGDLETIVAMAIEKSPTRRYQTASALATDLACWMRHEPISARPPSRMYQLRKFARRNKGLVASLAAIMLALTGGIIASSIALQLAREQEKNSADALIAERSAMRFVVETVLLADPNVRQSPDMSMRDMLATASLEVGDALGDRPQSEVLVRAAIGRAWAGLGEPELALPQLQRAVYLHREVLGSPKESIYELLQLQAVSMDMLDRARATTPWNDLLALGAELLADRQPALLPILRDLRPSIRTGDLAAVRAHLARIHAELHVAPEIVRKIVADELEHQGSRLRSPIGVAILEMTIDIRRSYMDETNTHLVRTRTALASGLMSCERLEEAVDLSRESVDLFARVLGEDHWYTWVARGRLGACLIDAEAYDEAAALLERGYERICILRPAANRPQRSLLLELIRLYEVTEQTDRADALRPTLAHLLNMDSTRPRGPELIRAFTRDQHDFHKFLSASIARMDARDHIDAMPEIVSGLQARSVTEPATLLVADNLVAWIQRMARRGVPVVEFEPLVRTITDIYLASPDGMYGLQQSVAFRLHAQIACGLDRPGQGADFARQAMQLALVAGPDHWLYLEATSVLGECLTLAGEVDAGRELLESSHAELERQLTPGSAVTRYARSRLAAFNERQGNIAEIVSTQLRALRKTRFDRESPRTLDFIAWELLIRRGNDPAIYREALADAQSCLDEVPDNHYIRNTVGVGHYRCGNFERCIDELMLSDSVKKEEDRTILDLAFIGMAHKQLGNEEQAFEYLELARRQFNRRSDQQSAEGTRVMDEAEATINPG